MYTLSLSIESPFKLNIHNQCLDVDLASPTYLISYGLNFCRAPDYKVCACNIMRSSFTVDDSLHELLGILTYKLQRRKSHESTEICKNTSSTIQLLMV
jgi:hypothetical protein